ncbi:MAG: hypothetical protein RI976_1026 [Actinomycetota bacterium]
MSRAIEFKSGWLVCQAQVLSSLNIAETVAYLDATMQVIKISKMKPLRLAMPVLKAKHVLEASAGTFENWGLAVGHTLEARRT